MRLRRAVYSLALALLCLPAPAEAQGRRFRELDAYITRALADWEVPGLAIAIVKDDSVVFARGYGVRELGRPDPVTPRTTFAAASTSKAFTAALMAMLVDSGRVEWDDRVSTHLPELLLHDPYVTRELTLRDLLSHRSGLSRGDRIWYASDLDREEVLRRVRHLEPSWSFRSRYGYQNIMFIAAGEVQERITGTSWDELVRERIFDPLGMRTTVTSTRDLDALPDVATPHARIDGRVVPIRWRNVDNVGPAGSINSNVLDMAEWVRLQLGKGEYEGRRLISAEAMREMHAPHTIIPVSERLERLNPDRHFRAYGLGWFLEDYRGRKVMQHGGNLDGFSAEVALMPEEGLGVVVLTNMNGTALRDALRYQVFDLFLGGREKDWSAAYLELVREGEARRDSIRAERETKRVAGTRPSLALSRYAGVYADSMHGQVVVRLEGDRLVAEAGPAYVGDLEHWHHDTFRIDWRDDYLGEEYATFRLNVDGEVSALDVEDWSEFGRVPEDEERNGPTPGGG